MILHYREDLFYSLGLLSSINSVPVRSLGERLDYVSMKSDGVSSIFRGRGADDTEQYHLFSG